MWTLVRIKATGQVVEMAPGVAQALIESGLAELAERVEMKSLVARGRELAARFCRSVV